MLNFIRNFLTFSFIEDCRLDHLEKSQENQVKYLCEILFTTNRPLTTEQETVSGEPFNLGTLIVPSRKILSACDSVGPTYMDLCTLAPHNDSKEKTDEFNASHSNNIGEKLERTNIGEKFFGYNQNVQTCSCVEEFILGQSFECKERGNALHDKAAFITWNSAYKKERAYCEFGRNVCNELALVSPNISTEKSPFEFHEDKCNIIGDSLQRVAQVHRTDIREKTFSQKAQFTDYQRNHTGVPPLECGKTLTPIQLLMYNREHMQ